MGFALIALALLSTARASGTTLADEDMEEDMLTAADCQLLQRGYQLVSGNLEAAKTANRSRDAFDVLSGGKMAHGGNAVGDQQQILFNHNVDAWSHVPHALPVLVSKSVVVEAKASAVTCFAPIYFIVVLFGVMVASVWSSTRPGSHATNEAAATVSNAQLFLQHLNYTLILPYSYMTAASLGLDATYSGFLIGTYMTGVLLGNIVMWSLFSKFPDMWRQGRRLSLVAAACNLAGALIYSAISSGIDLVEEEGQDRLPGSWTQGVAIALLSSRLLDGIGCGLVVQLAIVNIAHLFKSEERPSQMANNQFAVMMGIGIGPLIGSAVCRLDFCHPGSAALGANAIAYAGTSLTAAVVVGGCFPDLQDNIEDYTAAEVPKGAADTLSRNASLSKQEPGLTVQSKLVILCSGVVMNAIRGFVISGLEAATSLLLEEQYNWSRDDIGIAIGMCFLFCIPVKALYGSLKNHLKVTEWIRLLTILSIVGSLLLFTIACPGGNHCGWVLLLGDAVLFPTLFLGDGLSSGLMMMSNHMGPVGSWFDANHFTIYRAFMVSGIGRSFGPPLARWQIISGGQNSYATQQLALAVIYLAIFEIGVAPRAKLDD